MDPMYLGNYPEEGLRAYGKNVPDFPESDMDIIHQPLDLFGFNNYFARRVRMDDEGKVEDVQGPDGPPLTTMGWRVTPEGLYWGPKFFYERYNLPIVITENGMAGTDWVHLDGKVHDPARIDFLHRYLQQYLRASQDGVDCRGYFEWTFLDNFEWGFGYSKRFGIVYTDYETLERIPKDSAYWYRKTIETNGAEL
jgi:beta-glucosidase